MLHNPLHKDTFSNIQLKFEAISSSYHYHLGEEIEPGLAKASSEITIESNSPQASFPLSSTIPVLSSASLLLLGLVLHTPHSPAAFLWTRCRASTSFFSWGGGAQSWTQSVASPEPSSDRCSPAPAGHRMMEAKPHIKWRTARKAV